MSAPLLPHSLYRIELCSGEQRCWRYRGEDAQGNRWWRDEESDQEFNEASLMYAWQVLGPARPRTTCRRRSTGSWPSRWMRP